VSRGPSKDQDLIDELAAWMQAPDAETAQTNGHAKATAPTSAPRDEEIIQRCRSAENAVKFADLFDHGDTSGNGADHSAADFALLGILKFYTQDPDQLERLMRMSALARPKWDEVRVGRSWLRYSIENALKGSFETYDWGSRGRRPLLSSSLDPIGKSSDDDNNEDDLEVIFFADLGEPKEREYLIEKIGVKGYPIVAFGAGGVAKSFAMLAAGVAIASASGVENWLGLRVLEHGYVLYLDFELDVDEQHRRVRDLCAGMGVPIPGKLAYLSGVGVSTDAAFAKARAFVESHGAKAVIIDSMGLAMAGDMERAKDVLAFHSRLVNPLRRAGATPFIVDHEGKLQAGERRKDKSPIGSAYKAWAARNVLQFLLEEYDKENSSLDIRVRQQKTNFTPIEPFGVRFTFEDKKVSMETIELDDENLVEEDLVPLKKRIVAALRSESATNPELQEITGADAGSIRNKLCELRNEGIIGDDGYKGRNKLYRLLSSSSPSTKESSDDDNKPATVADLFSNPPDWLVKQLVVYHEDPARHLKPLCSAVAAVVLEDGTRALEVQEEVERELER
jgi:hypothetical protein